MTCLRTCSHPFEDRVERSVARFSLQELLKLCRTRLAWIDCWQGFRIPDVTLQLARSFLTIEFGLVKVVRSCEREQSMGATSTLLHGTSGSASVHEAHHVVDIAPSLSELMSQSMSVVLWRLLCRTIDLRARGRHRLKHRSPAFQFTHCSLSCGGYNVCQK